MLTALLKNDIILGILKQFKKEKTEELPKDTEVFRLLQETRAEIAACRANLAHTDDETLIDMYIYAIKANELRFAHLLQLAKKEGAVS